MLPVDTVVREFEMASRREREKWHWVVSDFLQADMDEREQFGGTGKSRILT